MRIVFFGTPAFSATFLKDLCNDPFFDVVGLVCQPDEPVGRKKILTPPPTKVAFQTPFPDRPIFQPTKLKDPAFGDALRTLNADAFVVVAYGRIIPQAVLDTPRLGCINVHPSLLPKYRGPSPMQAAIVNGDAETGISIMTLDAAMDHGDILAQVSFTLEKNETLVTLTEKVTNMGSPLLRDTLKNLFAGTASRTPQRHEDATFCHLLSQEDGIISSDTPAEIIDQKIRGLTPWPGVRTTVTLKNGEQHEVKILSAQILSSSVSLNDGSRIPSSTSGQYGVRDDERKNITVTDNKLFFHTPTKTLEILTVQPATKQAMSGIAYANGYSPERFGKYRV